MKVLIVSKELFPYTEGETANNVKELALALRNEGCEVTLVIPAYPFLLEQKELIPICNQNINIGEDEFRAVFFKTESSGLPVYLIYSPALFSKDQAESSVFFCKLVFLLIKKVLKRAPDILLANDWTTGLLMPLAKEEAKDSCGIFVIHNMAHGLIPSEKKHIIGLSEAYYREENMGFYGQISLLKAGIIYSDAIITLSPTYAKEIQTPEFGAGVDDVLRNASHKLYGILNGCNYTLWNPETDPFIKRCYSEDDLEGKLVCKKELLEELRIADSSNAVNIPIIAMPLELEEQNGCSLVISAANRLAEMGLIIISLGRGDPIVENLFCELKNIYPNNFYLLKRWDQITLHKLIAGADMLLIPSLFEPCGTVQMYGMRYGTLPIVRATGGLNDTVTDPEESFPGTGFKFYRADPFDMLKAIERALSAYKDKKIWTQMMKNAMKKRFLWSSTAKEYIKVFKELHTFLRKSPLPSF